MDNTSQAGPDPDGLVRHLAGLVEEDPRAVQDILARLENATDLPEELFADPSNPPWDALYRWMMDETTGDHYGIALGIALDARPKDDVLRELRAAYDPWLKEQERIAAYDEDKSTETGLGDKDGLQPDGPAEASKIDITQQAPGKSAPLDLSELIDEVETKGSPTQEAPAQEEPVPQKPRADLYEKLDMGGASSTMAVDDLLAAHPDLHKNIADSLRLAEGLSLQVEKPLDSVMLLIAILAQASRETLMGSGRLVLGALDQQAPFASPAYQAGVVTSLAEDYGIAAIPATYEEPASHGITAELLHVLDTADALNGRATPPFDYIPGRLVLAAMLVPELSELVSAARQYLGLQGYLIAPVSHALLAYIREKDATNEGLLVALGISESTGDGSPLGDGAAAEIAFLSAGYRSDVVDPDAPDQLDIMPEVRAISRVLASAQVRPPLSLGLFGDWGSGKSFFMAKMRKEIGNIAYTALSDGTSGFCSRIVQIEFNAWHFADANLWASLVSHIFGKLFSELSGQADADEQAREDLKAELQQADGLVQEANRELDEAVKEVEQAEASLEEARKVREAQERTLHARINDIASLLKDDQGVQAKLQEAGEALGYPEATATYDTLKHTAGELRSFSKRVAAIGQLFFQSPFTWVAIPFLVLVLLLPLVIDALLDAFPLVFGWINDTLAEVSALISGLALWGGKQITRLKPHLEAVEDAYAKAKAVREKRQQEDLADERRALDLAREREQAARDTLNAAQRKKQKIEHELSELSPDRQLYRLIEARSQDDRYSRHLGIISLIRKDFEQMSRHLGALATTAAGTDGEPPIQRIILYIDDLDRCRSERVVEVLEAIHLLLAFPLFVVVVGVDPRWLRRCLEAHYPDQLSDGTHKRRADEPEPDRVAVRASTPQDYLEKIFQIPFALRPISPDGYRDFIGELLKPLTAPAASGVDEETGRDAAPAQTPTEPLADEPKELPIKREEQALPEIVAEGEGGETLVAPPGESAGPAAGAGEEMEAELEAAPADEADALDEAVFERVPLNAEQLVFSPQEERDIKRLAPLFRTPRAVKRFINIYRLLRVGLDAAELSAFIGKEADEEPGEYRAALVLLAVVTGFPNLAQSFLHQLQAWLPLENNPDAVPWEDFLGTLTPDEADQEGWATLINRLQRLQQGSAPLRLDPLHIPFDEVVLDTWARRVARYSFSFNLREALDA